jgi:predicted ribosomally synthesized peptide with nif11-like leader
MSVVSATLFINKVMSDPSFAATMSRAASVAEKISIARKAGYDFNREEFEQAKLEIPLTDEELDAIAGGTLGNLTDTRSAWRIEPCSCFPCEVG